MPAYAPKVFSMIEERDMIDHLKVNGNLCMVPSFTKRSGDCRTLWFVKILEKVQLSGNPFHDDLEAFLIAVKEK